MLPRLILLVALYLTFDVADPMMPGVLAFSVDESVEARTAPRLPADDVATVAAPAPEWLQPIVERPVRSPVVARTPRLSRAHAPRPRPPAAAPAPSSEDD